MWVFKEQFYAYILLQYLPNFKCGLLPSLTEGVSNRKEGKDEPIEIITDGTPDTEIYQTALEYPNYVKVKY